MVEKDKSLQGFIDAGFQEFGPLIEFRDWLVQIRNDPERRMARRRDGRVTVMTNGSLVPGPFIPATRREILDRLLQLQATVGFNLISLEEIEIIEKIWADDAVFIASVAHKDFTIRTSSAKVGG